MGGDAVKKAKNIALRLLSYSQKTEGDIVKKLKAKGFTKKTIDSVVEELKSFNLIDDKRFAVEWLRSKSKNSLWGRARLLKGLEIKGISGDVIGIAVNETKDEISEEETIQRAFEKWLKRQGHGSGVKGQKEKARAFRYLISKGFQPFLINQLLKGHYKDAEEIFTEE